MKIKVVKLPPAIFTEQGFKKRLLEDVAKTKCPEIAKRNRAVIRDTVTRHYQNVLTQVGAKLKLPGGVEGVDSAGFRRLHFKGADGENRAVTTPKPWPALSEGWRNRKPVSLQFWHKSGDLQKAYFSMGLHKKATVRPIAGGTRRQVSKNRYVCQSRAKVGVQALPYPLSRFIVESFLTGEKVTIAAQGHDDRTGVKKSVFPEYFRPFISAMSASLGRRMHTKLRKIK